MIPAGYLLKRTTPPPGWLADERITEVCSVSNCVNDNVVEPSDDWKHNGFGVANSPEILAKMVRLQEVNATDSKLFYYEAFESEIESDGWTFAFDAWRPVTFAPSSVIPLEVQLPTGDLKFLGYDVVVFGDYLEHSPLSCNSVSESQFTNEYCLFDTLEAAQHAINSGGFGGGCEEGVYKILSFALLV